MFRRKSVGPALGSRAPPVFDIFLFIRTGEQRGGGSQRNYRNNTLFLLMLYKGTLCMGLLVALSVHAGAGLLCSSRPTRRIQNLFGKCFSTMALLVVEMMRDFSCGWQVWCLNYLIFKKQVDVLHQQHVIENGCFWCIFQLLRPKTTVKESKHTDANLRLEIVPSIFHA